MENKEYYFLVHWPGKGGKGPSSVVPESSVVANENGDGAMAMVKWRKRFCKAKILLKSSDKTWLESLVVTAAGIVYSPYPITEHAFNVTSQNHEPSTSRNIATTSTNPLPPIIISPNCTHSPPSSSSSTTPRHSKNMLSESQTLSDDPSFTTETPVNETASISSVLELSESGPPLMTDAPVVQSEPIMNIPIDNSETAIDTTISRLLSIFGPFTEENITQLEKAMKQVRMSYDVRTKKNDAELTGTLCNGVKTNIITDPLLCQNPYLKKVELFPMSGLFMSELDLISVRNQCSNNPKEMVRQLMKSLYGVERLKGMSPSGANGFEAIPKVALQVVENFVRENVPEDKRLTHAEYNKCLRLMCTTMRHPKYG